MHKRLETLIVVFSLLPLSWACSPKEKQNSFSKVEKDELSDAQKSELESILKKYLENNEDGSQELQGFKTSDKIDSQTNSLASQDFRDLSQSEEQVFEFIPPEGVEAEFSEPVMISGAALYLTNNLDDLKALCEGLAYQAEEPTMKEIIEHSQKTNTCGDVTVNFCIRLRMAQQIDPENPNYIYTESPDLNLNLPCPEDSFKELNIEIAEGRTHTSRAKEALKISALRSVVSVYFTNSPGCFDGGEWQDITRENPEWTLSFQDDTATVYAKFKDVFGAESDCISDSIAYGLATNQCFADLDYVARNVISGVKIGEIEGTAQLNYPVCTEDGQTSCIASNSFRAESSSGLAAKVIIGQTIGGVAGSVPEETHSPCNAGGQEDCIATDTFKSMDLSTKDSGGAIDIDNTVFSARVKSATSFEFWDDTGARHTASGDADIEEVNVADGVELFGVTGNAGSSPDCSAITVGGTWIKVPGDSNYRTEDFCVMKYEAKCSLADGSTCAASASTQSPTSTVAGTPWVSIDQQDAITECASLGKGFRLITNDEWMTIATNIAAQGINWDGGTVGTNEMTRGHSDNNPGNACAANASDSNSYVETDCTGSASGSFNQRRTHTLSNGEVLWDLAGNVAEWTNYFNDEEKPTPNTDDWYEYTLPISGNTTMPLTDLIPQVAIDNSWNSNHSIGQYYPGTDGSGGALLRGGRWYNLAGAGVFYADMWGSATYSTTDIGFRCTVSQP